MLRSTKELEGLKLAAKDGDIGRCHSFLFDSHYWMIRAMVVRLERRRSGRKVLISPVCIGHLPERFKRIPVHLTRAQVEGASLPRLEERAQREQALDPTLKAAQQPPRELQSTAEVLGCCVEAAGGAVGRVTEFVIDDRSWMIKYVIACAGHWPKRRDVLISVHWIRSLTSHDHRLKTNMPAEMVEDGTPFKRNLLNHPIDVHLYDYYDRPAHWVPRDL